MGALQKELDGKHSTKVMKVHNPGLGRGGPEFVLHSRLVKQLLGFPVRELLICMTLC